MMVIVSAAAILTMFMIVVVMIVLGIDQCLRQLLLDALRLSGLPDELQTVREVLRPEAARVDREAAWAAVARDKKADRGAPRLVLLDAPGRPRWGVEVPEADVRRALDELIEDRQ